MRIKRKGQAGIIAMVIFFAALFTVGTAFFLNLIRLGNQYDQALSQMDQRQIEMQSESLILVTGTFQNGTLYVNATNTGGVSMKLLAYFTSFVGSLSHGNLSILLSVGQFSGFINAHVNCLAATTSFPCSIELLTQRGRTFSQVYPNPLVANVCTGFESCLSESTSGIGALSFDFEAFYYYHGANSYCVGITYPTGCLLNPQGRAYSVSNSKGAYIAFSVSVKNVDPLKRTLVIGFNSYLEAPQVNPTLSGGGKTFEAVYQIGTVSGNLVAPFSSVTIAPNQIVTIWFVQMLAGGNPTDAPQWDPSIPVTPAWLFFTGTIGGQPWGENFPLTAITWVS